MWSEMDEEFPSDTPEGQVRSREEKRREEKRRDEREGREQ